KIADRRLIQDEVGIIVFAERPAKVIQLFLERFAHCYLVSQASIDYKTKMATLEKTVVSEEQVEKIALLSRLSITAAERQAFARQLSSILNYFQQMASVDTQGIEPLVTPTDMVSQWREDKIQPWRGAEAAAAEAPERVGNLFKVPPVVGGG